MDGNYEPYDYLKSSERIREILNQPAGAFQEVDGLPDRDKLTFTNGFYGTCSALFIDIRGSSALTEAQAPRAREDLSRVHLGDGRPAQFGSVRTGGKHRR